MADRRFLVGLIGAGVRPSLTPALHMAEADALGIPYLYRAIDIAELGMQPDAIGDLIAYARAFGFDALNITHPCKQLVIPHLDKLDADADLLQSVNTVIFDGESSTGYNTDLSGFGRSFTRGLPGADLGEVVQLGAGGAGYAVAHALIRSGVERLVIVDQDEARSRALAEAVASHFGPDASVHAPVADLPAALKRASGVVQCTPTGMAEHPGTPFAPELLRPSQWVADIVYRPFNTALIQAAHALGCRTLNGSGMAVFQAVDAFALITGVAPDSARMMRHMEQLAGR